MWQEGEREKCDKGSLVLYDNLSETIPACPVKSVLGGAEEFRTLEGPVRILPPCVV